MFNMELFIMLNTNLGTYGHVKPVFQTWILLFFGVIHGGHANGDYLYIRLCYLCVLLLGLILLHILFSTVFN